MGKSSEEFVLAAFGHDVYHACQYADSGLFLSFSLCGSVWEGGGSNKPHAGAWNIWRKEWAEAEDMRECKTCTSIKQN